MIIFEGTDPKTENVNTVVSSRMLQATFPMHALIYLASLLTLN